MTDTDTTGATQGQENLTALRMADLRAIASGKGIRGISAMRKHELIAAIQGARSGQAPAAKKSGEDSGSAGRDDAAAPAEKAGSSQQDGKTEEAPKSRREKQSGDSGDQGNKGDDQPHLGHGHLLDGHRQGLQAECLGQGGAGDI